MVLPPAAVVVGRDELAERVRRHQARVHEVTRVVREAEEAGRSNPIEGFLFTYYRWPRSRLERWFPGVGVVVEGSDPARFASRGKAPRRGRKSGPPPQPKHYHRVLCRDGVDMVVVDVDSWLADHHRTAKRIHEGLLRIAARPARFGCFGRHEWAMLYRAPQRLHQDLPLRLSQAEIDAEVESSPVMCSHAEAFRFFTPEAQPLNVVSLRGVDEFEHEQAGCVHAAMDLYRFAFTLAPMVGAELVVECYAHARKARILDMRASPYDVSGFGFSPVCIETPEGRAEYVSQQRELADVTAVLRAQILEVTEVLVAASAAEREGETRREGETQCEDGTRREGGQPNLG